jgi:hypothetical protein
VKGGLLVLAGIFAVLGMLVFATSFYTAGKLERGKMVRGDIPGATFFTGTVASTELHEGYDRREGRVPDQCKLTVNVKVDGTERTIDEWMTAPCTDTPNGSTVEIARVPGDSSLYLKNGTWASVGNRALDETFLFAERSIGFGLAGLAGLLAIGGALARGSRKV